MLAEAASKPVAQIEFLRSREDPRPVRRGSSRWISAVRHDAGVALITLSNTSLPLTIL